MAPGTLRITSDFICPWCWIGHSKLKQALANANLLVHPQVAYLPFELNPSMPTEGLDRKAYRSAKFGSWAKSQAMDAEVAAAGGAVGAEFNYDLVRVTPNTRLAHRLMQFAQQQDIAAAVESLYESIFAAYFSRGADIGKADVLLRLAEAAGFDKAAASQFLDQDVGMDALVAAEREALADGINSVPVFRIGAARVSGAQPAHTLERVLRVHLAAGPRGASLPMLGQAS